jgi:hypothetical protein
VISVEAEAGSIPGLPYSCCPYVHLRRERGVRASICLLDRLFLADSVYGALDTRAHFPFSTRLSTVQNGKVLFLPGPSAVPGDPSVQPLVGSALRGNRSPLPLL